MSSFFSERVTDVWNALSPDSEDFSSLVKFKLFLLVFLSIWTLSDYFFCYVFSAAIS